MPCRPQKYTKQEAGLIKACAVALKRRKSMQQGTYSHKQQPRTRPAQEKPKTHLMICNSIALLGTEELPVVNLIMAENYKFL